MTVEERAVGAYLGLAIGDALGATTEFMTPREIVRRYGEHREIVGGGWLKLRPGAVTDDTGMSLALGASILRHGRVDARAVAEAFSDWMSSKPVDIGNTVRHGIKHYRKTGETVVPEDPQHAGNGACMRCLPIALLNWQHPRADLLRDARIQSHITHNCAAADAGTAAILTMLISALRGEPLSQLHAIAQSLAAEQPVFGFEGPRVENPSGWIVDTLKAVFQALFGNGNFEAVLVDVVNRGGDADTTGAIAGMVAGASYGSRAIPARWKKALDPAIHAACEQQARALLIVGKRPCA
ncbi:MAG: ADP-ribosyl-[dinitrogen reductase] hydrolase [Sedimenticolaceae bacterium]